MNTLDDYKAEVFIKISVLFDQLEEEKRKRETKKHRGVSRGHK